MMQNVRLCLCGNLNSNSFVDGVKQEHVSSVFLEHICSLLQHQQD